MCDAGTLPHTPDLPSLTAPLQATDLPALAPARDLPLLTPVSPQKADVDKGVRNSHSDAIGYLRSVYTTAASGFGSEHAFDGSAENLGNMQYGEITYKGMEALYSALKVRSEDVFYDLGSGTGKLVFYVALRGEVARSVGVEVGERRHSIALKASGLLDKDLEDCAQTGGRLPQLEHTCSKFSVVQGDIRKKCYEDASVVVMSNLCMSDSLQRRCLDNLLRCTSFRRLVTVSPLPHARLKLQNMAHVGCTWSKISSWHVYEVLGLPTPSGRSQLFHSALGRPLSATTTQVQRSSSLPSLVKTAAMTVRAGAWRKSTRGSDSMSGTEGVSQRTGRDWRVKRKDWLLPPSTPNLLCNWSPVSKDKVLAVIKLLEEALGNSDDAGVFYDLGCGDGRVVRDVCSAFPHWRGVGIDLNAKLVECAQQLAEKASLEERCEFRVADVSSVNLADASAVFLYLPPAALSKLSKTVFPGSGLAKGTMVFSADGPLPTKGRKLERFAAKSFTDDHLEDKLKLRCYTWQGKPKTLDSDDLNSESGSDAGGAGS